jgi:DNA gyrase inhibitor GyrI
MFSLPLIIERSIVVAKPIDETFNLVADFNYWKSWSPWLCQEPDCPVTISGKGGQVGHTQFWDGKRIGSGETKLMAINAPHRLDYELTFLKPWKSKSKVIFDFEPASNGTKVVWKMQGTLPVFLLPVRDTMNAAVANDFERGLAMLKEMTETGTVASKLDVVGEVSRDGFHFIGKRRSCTLNEVGPLMEKDFSDLFAMVKAAKVPPPDFPFSFYHQYDLVSRRCEYMSGFAYKSPPAVSDEQLERGNVENHKALRIDHLGTYRHLGNAWQAVQGLLRASGHKASKHIPMYEIYANFPGQVDDKDIKTMVHIPLR